MSEFYKFNVINIRTRCFECGSRIDNKMLKSICNEMRLSYGTTKIGDKTDEIRADSYRHFVTTFNKRECCYSSQFASVCCNLPIWQLERPKPPPR